MNFFMTALKYIAITIGWVCLLSLWYVAFFGQIIIAYATSFTTFIQCNYKSNTIIYLTIDR